MKLMSIGLVDVDAVTPDEMADLCYLESKVLPLEMAASAAANLCRGLQQCSKRLADHAGSPASFAQAEQELEWLQNYQGKAAACANNAGALLTTCERAVQLLDRVLNLKSQQVAQQQNTAILALTKSTVDDSATVRVITAITLVYLSCTVVAVGYPFQWTMNDILLTRRSRPSFPCPSLSSKPAKSRFRFRRTSGYT